MRQEEPFQLPNIFSLREGDDDAALADVWFEGKGKQIPLKRRKRPSK